MTKNVLPRHYQEANRFQTTCHSIMVAMPTWPFTVEKGLITLQPPDDNTLFSENFKCKKKSMCQKNILIKTPTKNTPPVTRQFLSDEG